MEAPSNKLCAPGALSPHRSIRHRLLWRLWPRSKPVPPGLWLLNWFCQHVLEINGNIPWNVHFTSRVQGKITIGRNVWVSFAVSGGCYIQGGNGLEIGDDTIFAPGVTVVSANHDPADLSKWLPGPPVEIGKRCWIGAHATILPGVVLGDDVIVGAGAVVTRSFGPGSRIGGVPARLLKMRPQNPHELPARGTV